MLENIQWIFSVKDYIRFRLTGEAYGEVTDFSGTNLMNLITAAYDRELLGEFGLEQLYVCLPPLRYSTDLCGSISAEASSLTGLKKGTPVSGGMFDIDACAVAMDVTDEKNLCVIAGTWSINEYIATAPVKNKSVMMNSLFCLPGYYLVEESSPTSAGNHEWFVKMFLRELAGIAKEKEVSVYRLADELAQEVEADKQTMIFLPYLYGSNYNPKAKSCMIGFDSSHTMASIIRAVLEGIAFCHMDHIDKLLSNRLRPDAVWVQIFADVFNLPIEVVDTEELGALGCAMSAAVSIGVYGDLKQAAEHMVHIKKRVEPIMKNVEVYKEKRTLYQTVAKALDPVWGRF